MTFQKDGFIAHYKNKKETADKFGKEQVHKWRRSFDVSPPGGEIS